MTVKQRDLYLTELRQMMRWASEPFSRVDWGRIWFTLIPGLAGGLKPEEITRLSLEKWKELFGVNAFEIAVALQATVIEREFVTLTMNPTFNATRGYQAHLDTIRRVHRLVRYLDPS